MQSFKNHLTEQNHITESIATEAAKFVGEKLWEFVVWFAQGSRPGSIDFTPRGVRVGIQFGASRIAILIAIFVALRVSFFTIKKFIDNIDDIIYNIRNTDDSQKEKVANNILLDYGINPNARIEQPSFSEIEQAKDIERKT